MPVTREISSEEWKRTLDYYRANAARYAAEVASYEMDRSLDDFTGHLSEGDVVLDVGCGSGRDLTALKRRGFAVIGVEIVDELAEIARRSSNSKVVTADLRNMPFNQCSFDGVWASAALLHLPRRELTVALREIGRVLKPAGVFFLSLKEGRGEITDDRGRKFTLFQEEELVSQLKSNGFIVHSIARDPTDLSDVTSKNWISIISKKGTKAHGL